MRVLWSGFVFARITFKALYLICKIFFIKIWQWSQATLYCSFLGGGASTNAKERNGREATTGTPQAAGGGASKKTSGAETTKTTKEAATTEAR